MSSRDKTTRVDGLGLWRSWTRNFKTKQLALLDLIDNSLDAAIEGQNCDGFTGKVHLFPDIYGKAGYDKATTGICIVNNCKNPIRPLGKVLEAYNSSKVDSGAGDIGENGVGLKQGCATLSDLSFVLVKNENENIELGIIAKQLQREDGCYLPAFTFSTKLGPPLNEQMIILFSHPNHADVANCVAQYGAGSSSSDLSAGVERLCQHLNQSLFNERFVFMVIINRIHQVDAKEMNAQQKLIVNNMLKELYTEIPRLYLHVPNSFEFMIGNKRAEFKYWPERLVELSSFTVKINKKIPWQDMFNPTEFYELRIFVGFDGIKMTDSTARKEMALYVYSRQSGRLISQTHDARTLCGLQAGGTEFCQGLTVIIDDAGGNLPLNPTKQDGSFMLFCFHLNFDYFLVAHISTFACVVAFGEETHGETHKENLMAMVGCVTHFFYHYHLAKYNGRKTDLTREVARFGDDLLKSNRKIKTLDSSNLTMYNLSLKQSQKSIRVEKNTAEEICGADTLYRLLCVRDKKASQKIRHKQSTLHDDEQSKTDEEIDSSNFSSVPRRRLSTGSHERIDVKEKVVFDKVDRKRKKKAATKSLRQTHDVENSKALEKSEAFVVALTQKCSDMRAKIISQRTKIESQKAEIKSLKIELAQLKGMEGIDE